MSLKTKAYPLTQIQKVVINCRIFKIHVVASDNESMELSWSNSVMRSLEIQQSDGVLTVLDHAAIGVYGALALINLKKDAQLLIKLPASYSGKLILQTREESVYISNIQSSATVGISTGTGEILLESVSFKKLDIRGNAGKTNGYSLDVTDSMQISSKSGSISCNLIGCEAEYTVSCATRNRRSDGTGVIGTGEKKVLLNSEHGEIHYSFQNGITTAKPSSRYNRRNSFNEW